MDSFLTFSIVKVPPDLRLFGVASFFPGLMIKLYKWRIPNRRDETVQRNSEFDISTITITFPIVKANVIFLGLFSLSRSRGKLRTYHFYAIIWISVIYFNLVFNPVNVCLNAAFNDTHSALSPRPLSIGSRWRLATILQENIFDILTEWEVKNKSVNY